MRAINSKGTFRVAVVGDFQIGKSSLVNCLLSESLAETGERFEPMTDAVTEYDFTNGVSLVDTPGFNDKRTELTNMTNEEIVRADAVLFIKMGKTLGDRDIAILKATDRKPLIVLFNCDERTIGTKGSDPELSKNEETCKTIQSQFAREGILPYVLAIGNCPVTPINILWAQFGIGLPLSDEQRHDVVDFARERLGVAFEGDLLRSEMLHRSGFLPVREFLMNLPLELLKHAVLNPQREIDRIVDRFAAKLKKRWTAA